MKTPALDRAGFANPLDRAIAVVAPQWAMRRVAARARIAQAELSLRRYEGAGRGRRLKGWHTSNGSQNAEALQGLGLLRSRSRDLTRNNSWARKAVRAWTNNIVGHGITPTFEVPGSAAMGDDIAEEFERWAESTAVDPEGRLNFYGMQELGVRGIIEAGEFLARYRIRRRTDGLRIPLQLQLLEADHLDESITAATSAKSTRIIQGVEYGAIGQRVAYHLFRDHPGEIAYPANYQSNRVAADQVLHVFRPDRIGQARGVPWGAACIVVLRDFDEFTDAQLVRQKIAAMFVGFVTSTDTDDLEDTVGDPDEATEDRGSQDFEPGTWEHLPLGRDVTFSTPPKIEEFEEYAKVTLQQAAAGFGTPYEVLSGDLSNVNFHSGRLGRVEFGAEGASFRRLYLIPQFCNPVVRRWLTVAVLAGKLRDQALTAAIDWTPPAPVMVEPGREIRAQKDAVRAGFKTRSQVIRELGGVPARVFRERAKEDEQLRELGLNPDDTPLPADTDEEPDEFEELDDPSKAADKRAKNREAEIELERDPA